MRVILLVTQAKYDNNAWYCDDSDAWSWTDSVYVLTGKNPGGIGPPDIPSWGFIWPNGLGAAAFYKDKQKIFNILE